MPCEVHRQLPGASIPLEVLQYRHGHRGISNSVGEHDSQSEAAPETHSSSLSPGEIPIQFRLALKQHRDVADPHKPRPRVLAPVHAEDEECRNRIKAGHISPCQLHCRTPWPDPFHPKITSESRCG